MFRLALAFTMVLALVACKNGDKEKENEDETTTSGGMLGTFKEGSLPYQLSDTGLLKNADTATIPAASITSLIADSIRNNYFGKGAKVRFSPMVKLPAKEETYYIVKATAGAKKAAFLLVYEKENFGAAYPLLLPDADNSTSQVTTIDKHFTITKSITQRDGVAVSGEGKEVVAYDATNKNFSLIMLDALNENQAEVISPIDTFPRTNKLAGDYYINKKNLISIRDGRYPNQLMVYVHTENSEGDCSGELRGEFLMTTSTTAVYRQGGDPCVLTRTFKGNKVSINEERGCGNYRGLDCPLTGTFTLKKPQSAKPSSAKAKRK
jgi:hypothetical protein